MLDLTWTFASLSETVTLFQQHSAALKNLCYNGAFENRDIASKVMGLTAGTFGPQMLEGIVEEMQKNLSQTSNFDTLLGSASTVGFIFARATQKGSLDTIRKYSSSIVTLLLKLLSNSNLRLLMASVHSLGIMGKYGFPVESLQENPLIDIITKIKPVLSNNDPRVAEKAAMSLGFLSVSDRTLTNSGILKL